MDQPLAPQDRSTFPADAAAWLAGRTPRAVVVLGNALLAQGLTAHGHDVTHVPAGTRPLPCPDRSVDAVIAVQSLPDLDDVARVLRAGGHVALVHNARDHRIPWARKLDKAIGTPPPPDDPASGLVTSTKFGFVDELTYRHWQVVNDATLGEMMREELDHLDEPDRHQRIAAALLLYADYGRGADGMQLPWVSRCFRATVVESAWSTPVSIDDSGELPAVPATDHDTDTDTDTEQERSIEDTTSMLLIDFR